MIYLASFDVVQQNRIQQKKKKRKTDLFRAMFCGYGRVRVGVGVSTSGFIKEIDQAEAR